MPQDATAYTRAPRNRLPANPEITSTEDLDTALHELSWIASRRAAVQAACDQRVEQLRAEAARDLVIPVEGRYAKLPDRQKELEAAVLAYAGEHRDELLGDGKAKSRKFTHGQLSWRTPPARVEYRPGEKADSVLARIDEATGLLKKLLALLKRVKFGGIPLGLLLTCRPSVSLSTIKAGWVTGDVTDAQLAELGLQVTADPESISLQTWEYTVDPEQAA